MRFSHSLKQKLYSYGKIDLFPRESWFTQRFQERNPCINEKALYLCPHLPCFSFSITHTFRASENNDTHSENEGQIIEVSHLKAVSLNTHRIPASHLPFGS